MNFHTQILVRGLSWLPTALNPVLAAWLGYTFIYYVLAQRPAIPPMNATLALHLLNPSNNTRNTGDTQNIARVPGVTDVERITGAHLFGQRAQLALDKQRNALPSVMDAPKTKLNLTLVGTLHSDQAESAKAVIRNAEGETKEYNIGAAVAQGVQLAEIHPGQVLLARNGQYEVLPLVRNSLTSASSIAFSEDPTPSNRNRSAQLEQARTKILASPANMADYIRLYPHQQNGRFLGYRLQPGKKFPEMFADLGLQPDDVVTSVNGIVLDTALKGLSAMEQLATTNQVSLQVLRQGRTEFLTIPIVH